MPSLDNLIKDYASWKIKVPDLHNLSRSKQFKWKRKYDPIWTEEYPWLLEVKINNDVVGVLCKICRKNINNFKSHCQIQKNKGKFVTVPFVQFGNFTDAARKHEFGSIVDKALSPTVVRNKVINGVIKIPNTTHMDFYLKQELQKQYAIKGNTIDNTLKILNNNAIVMNQKGMLQLCSMLHRIIKRRDSPYSSLKDAVLFSIKILECHSLKHILTKELKGVSHRKIEEMIAAIHSLVLLGIYVEMVDGLENGDTIVFGGSIDLGSRVKKTKEYAGVGIKYCVLSKGTVVCRVIAFSRCVRKDGLQLITTFNDAVHQFNDEIKKMKALLGYLFPTDLENTIELDLKNMHSLAVDGACISKALMINKRVLEFNPRCIVSHCGSHKTALVSNDSIKQNARHQNAHEISCKLFDLVNASPKFEDLFKQCQVQTQESKQFKSNKPVTLSDRPMNRWESTLKFNRKILKLLLSIESFLAEIKERRWAENAKQTQIFPANYLRKKFPKVKYLLTIATETDILEILVGFILKTEFIDNDLMTYLEAIEDVELDLNNLLHRPGKNVKKMINNFLHGDLNDWLDPEEDECDENSLIELHDESIQLFIDLWRTRFEDKGKSEMFLFFSMKLFKQDVTTLIEANQFGKEHETQLIKYYCEEVDFIAEYPEAKGKRFVAPAIGCEDDLVNELNQYKRYIFRHYKGKNSLTQKSWTTKEVLIDLLANSKTLPWLSSTSILRLIIKAFIIQITESSDIERVMSVFTLFDNKWNQASENDLVEKVVIIQKESPSWELFDSEAALIIWRKQKDKRNIILPKITVQKLHESSEKSWLKPLYVIKAAHEKRKDLFRKRQEADEIHSVIEGDYDSDNVDSDSEKEDDTESQNNQSSENDVIEDKDDTENSEELQLTSTTNSPINNDYAKDNCNESKNNIDDIPSKKVKYEQNPNAKYKKIPNQLRELHKTFQENEEKALKLCIKLKTEYADYMSSFIEKNAIFGKNIEQDELGSSLIPLDVGLINPIALESEGNGNCLYNSISILKCGNQDASELLRMLTSIELYFNAAKYIDHNSLISASVKLRRKPEMLFPDMLAIANGQNEWYKNFNQLYAIRKEAVAISKTGQFSSFLSIIGLSNILHQPIRSIYPEVPYNIRPLFNQIVNPFETHLDETLNILWSRYKKLDDGKNRWFVPNHFVPVIEH